MRAPKESMTRLFVVANFVATVMSGCSASDLSGYRPVDKSEQRVESGDASGDNPGKTATESSEVQLGTTSISDVEQTAVGRLESIPASALAPVNVIDGADVAMLLKVAPKEAASAAIAGNPTSLAPSRGAQPAGVERPRVVELLIPERTFTADSASKALRVSYDDLDLLKVLNLEPVSANAVDLMPGWLKNLNGQRIKIRGFMYPTFESEGIERFVLARDNQICCFGRDPKVYDLVQVDMKSGTTTNYIPATRAFDVVGRFRIEMISEEGKPYGLYFIEDAEVVDR